MTSAAQTLRIAWHWDGLPRERMKRMTGAAEAGFCNGFAAGVAFIRCGFSQIVGTANHRLLLAMTANAQRAVAKCIGEDTFAGFSVVHPVTGEADESVVGTQQCLHLFDRFDLLGLMDWR